jgi:CMP/dCMP kinase
VVVIFGLSGSGKSTLANRIGEEFALRVIHPSGIMRDLLEGKRIDLENTRQNDGYWESEEGIKLFTERLSDDLPVDVKANEILLQEVEKGGVVIDTWSLPWLTPRGLKFHITADLEVRALRAAQRGGITYERALEVISMKDEETRHLFQRLYGFDIKLDLEVFDHTLDTNEMTAEDVFERVCLQLRAAWFQA